MSKSEACKRFKHEAPLDVGRGAHDLYYEVQACLDSKVPCKKRTEQCLGSCGGNGRQLLHDIHTTIAKAELSEDIIGDSLWTGSYANCTEKSITLPVELFEGGDSFKTWVARAQVRCKFTGAKPFCYTRLLLNVLSNLECDYFSQRE